MKPNRSLRHRSRAGVTPRLVLWAMLASALVLAACAGPGTDPVDGFALNVEQDTVTIAPGTSETLDVTLTRIAPFTGSVTLTVDENDLPTGVTADTPTTIAQDETTATVTLTADADAPSVEDVSVEVVGTAGAQVGSDTVLVTVGENGTAPAGDPGTPDQSLGSNGTATYTPAGTDLAAVHDIEVLADGSIILAGTATSGLAGTPTYAVVLAHVSASGELLTNFGTGGVVTEDAASEVVAVDAEVQGDWLLVAYVVNGSENDIVVSRYALDTGALDTGYGHSGEALTMDAATDVAIAGDGYIYVTGYANQPEDTDFDTDFVTYRFDAEGTLDTGFGSNAGIDYRDQGGNDEAHGVLAMDDGGVIVFGATNVNAGADFVAIRYGADGSFDESFGNIDVGTAGRLQVDFGAGDDFAYAAAEQDGQIILGGEVDSGQGDTDFGMVRLNADGSVDTTFGTDGFVTSDFGGNMDAIVAIEVQDDGRIVVAGTSGLVDGTHEMVLERYLPNGQLDDSFAGDGKVVIDFGVDAQAHALALTSDRVLVGGEAGASAALAAFWR